MGPPQLMGAFNSDASVKKACPSGLKGLLAERDARFNVNYEEKAEQREDITVPTLHPGKESLGIPSLATIQLQNMTSWPFLFAEQMLMRWCEMKRKILHRVATWQILLPMPKGHFKISMRSHMWMVKIVYYDMA
jgi:hypothetical protein